MNQKKHARRSQCGTRKGQQQSRQNIRCHNILLSICVGRNSHYNICRYPLLLAKDYFCQTQTDTKSFSLYPCVHYNIACPE